jgi:hypothetical protein
MEITLQTIDYNICNMFFYPILVIIPYQYDFDLSPILSPLFHIITKEPSTTIEIACIHNQ